MVTLRGVRRLRRRLGVQSRRLGQVTSPLVQVGRDRGMSGQPRIKLAQRSQSGAGAVRLTHGHRPIESRDRTFGETDQFVVPPHDLYPIGLGRGPRVGMKGGDRGLGLVFAQPVSRQRRLQERHPLGDQRRVPQVPVLFGQRHQRTMRRGASRSAGVVQQHQRQQPGCFRIIDQRGQLTRQPDRLGSKIHVTGIALIEDQVEHSQHRGHVTRFVQFHICQGAFRPRDALRHGRLGDEVGAGDLTGGQPAECSKRQCDGARRAQ